MDIFLSIFEWLLNALTDFANTLLSVLPKSPFSDLLNTFSNIPYLGLTGLYRLEILFTLAGCGLQL